jgi:hypothetical protein
MIDFMSNPVNHNDKFTMTSLAGHGKLKQFMDQ